MRYHNLQDVGLTFGGIVAVTIGMFFPLFRVNPARPADAPVPLGYALEQSTGIQGLDVALLIPAGIVGVLLVTERFRLHRAALSVLIGLLAVGFSIHYLFGSSFGFGATVTFVPALGWYGLVVGGILLAIAGGRHLIERLLRLATPTTVQG